MTSVYVVAGSSDDHRFDIGHARPQDFERAVVLLVALADDLQHRHGQLFESGHHPVVVLLGEPDRSDRHREIFGGFSDVRVPFFALFDGAKTRSGGDQYQRANPMWTTSEDTNWFWIVTNSSTESAKPRKAS